MNNREYIKYRDLQIAIDKVENAQVDSPLASSICHLATYADSFTVLPGLPEKINYGEVLEGHGTLESSLQQHLKQRNLKLTDVVWQEVYLYVNYKLQPKLTTDSIEMAIGVAYTLCCDYKALYNIKRLTRVQELGILDTQEIALSEYSDWLRREYYQFMIPDLGYQSDDIFIGSHHWTSGLLVSVEETVKTLLQTK